MPSGLYKQPSSVIAQELDQDLVLFQVDSEVYYSLDSVGRKFWSAALTHSAIDDAVDALLSEYDADKDTIRADFLEFTSKLTESGLLEIAK